MSDPGRQLLSTLDSPGSLDVADLSQAVIEYSQKIDRAYEGRWSILNEDDLDTFTRVRNGDLELSQAVLGQIATAWREALLTAIGDRLQNPEYEGDQARLVAAEAALINFGNDFASEPWSSLRQHVFAAMGAMSQLGTWSEDLADAIVLLRAFVDIGILLDQSDGTKERVELGPRPQLPTPILRVDRLDGAQLQTALAALEELSAAASAILLGDSLDDEEVAVLSALRDSAIAEVHNPRPDPITVERIASRLAGTVSRSAEVGPDLTMLEQLGLDGSEADELVFGARELVAHADIGQLDPVADVTAARAVTEEALALLSHSVEAAVNRATEDPDSPLAHRLGRIEESLERARPSWASAIGQDLVAAAVLAVLGWLGYSGLALKALIWVLIAVYNLT